MTLLTSIRLFLASLLLRSPPPEVEETIDMTVQKAKCDLESCMPPTIDDDHSFHSRDVSIPQGDAIEPNLHKALEEDASQLPTQTMLNAYVFPSYPLTLYLAKKPEKAIQTGGLLEIPHTKQTAYPTYGKVLGVRAFDEGWVEFVVEYGEAGRGRRDSLMVPLIWARLSSEERRLHAMSPLLRQENQSRTIPDLSQQQFPPCVKILSDLQKERQD
ncbi:hypothetical protein BC835DRAFT_1305399 [Cytidiella melzeri]|nr:hypothetical protein BC835DRAFT_1305399 [Cytidiella melzeri]